MEKTVIVDAAKEYSVWEFKDRAEIKKDNNELLQELNKAKTDLERYRILEETGLMVSFYDIIDWFNKEYLGIKEESKILPKIELEVDKWEFGTKEKVLFSFLKCSKQDISFTEEPINLRDLFHREIEIQNNLKNLYYMDKVEKGEIFSLVLKCIGINGNLYKEIKGLSQETMKQYRAIVDKHYDYLKAYEYFTQRNNKLSKAVFSNNEHTTINTGIYGNDPFRNLTKMAISFGQGGNEPAYIMTYVLGTELLEKPIFKFHEMEDKFGDKKVLNRDDILNKDYHEVAKTLKLCKSYLPFEIKSTK